MTSLDENSVHVGEVALILEHYDSNLCIRGYTSAVNKEFSAHELRDLYLADAIQSSDVEDNTREQVGNYFLNKSRRQGLVKQAKDPTKSSFASRYKPVAIKVKPIYAELPERYRIRREIQGDPLEGIPVLSLNPSKYTPIGRYTPERKEVIDQAYEGNFLWPEERKLMHHLMMEENQAFAWDDTERGSF